MKGQPRLEEQRGREEAALPEMHWMARQVGTNFQGLQHPSKRAEKRVCGQCVERPLQKPRPGPPRQLELPFTKRAAARDEDDQHSRRALKETYKGSRGTFW